MTPVKATRVIEWINREMPPLTWNIVSIKIMKTLVQQGISARNINDDTVFNETVVNEINRILKETYKKEMPKL
jgi:hypothetical protein